MPDDQQHAARRRVDQRQADEEWVEQMIRLPPGVWAEIERLVRPEERAAFYQTAVERELLLRENSE